MKSSVKVLATRFTSGAVSFEDFYDALIEFEIDLENGELSGNEAAVLAMLENRVAEYTGGHISIDALKSAIRRDFGLTHLLVVEVGPVTPRLTRSLTSSTTVMAGDQPGVALA